MNSAIGAGQPVVFVDVDEVCCDLVGAWLERYNERWADDLTKGEVLSWDIESYTRPECGRAIYDLLTPDVYDVAAPIPGALAGVERLRSMGARVVFATSTGGGGLAHAKRWWLEHHRFLARQPDPRPQPDIVFIYDKSLLRGAALVDDRPENLAAWGRRGLLFEAAWNRTAGRYRCNWATVPGAVSEILRMEHRP